MYVTLRDLRSIGSIVLLINAKTVSNKVSNITAE